jgi:hypothetical protein
VNGICNESEGKDTINSCSGSSASFELAARFRSSQLIFLETPHEFALPDKLSMVDSSARHSLGKRLC